MTRTDPQFKLRLPEDLKEKLEAAAQEYGRSVTGEIVYRLEKSFPSIQADVMLRRGWEQQRLERAIEKGVAEVAAYESRLANGDYGQMGKEDLERSIERKKQELASFQNLLIRVMDDIDHMRGESSIRKRWAKASKRSS